METVFIKDLNECSACVFLLGMSNKVWKET